MSHVYVLTLTNASRAALVHRRPRRSRRDRARRRLGRPPDARIIAAIRDKKLLPVADIDRGFVHPTYPAQVIVSYYEAGKMCDYIAKRWGESKLLDMVHEFARKSSHRRRDPRPAQDGARGLRQRLHGRDRQGNQQDCGRVSRMDQRLKDLFKLPPKTAKRRRDREAAAASKASIPITLKTATFTRFIANACIKKGDKACALDELGRYNKIGGRDPDTVKSTPRCSKKPAKLKKRPPLSSA